MKYQNVTVTDCDQLIQEHNPLILDCRDVKNYQAGHLDNALHVHEGFRTFAILPFKCIL